MFSKPDIGYISGDYILPGGMSIYDKKSDKIVGYLSMGMSLGKLVNSLMQTTHHENAFTIVDKENNILISSEPNIEMIGNIDS